MRPVLLYCSRSQLSGFGICLICARRFFVLPVKKRILKSGRCGCSVSAKVVQMQLTSVNRTWIGLD